VSKAAASRRRRTPAKTQNNNVSEQRKKEIQLEDDPEKLSFGEGGRGESVGVMSKD